MSWFKKIFGSSEPPEVPAYLSENGDLTDDQIDRKKRSEERLHRQGFPINPHLPCVESLTEVNLPAADEVFQRFVALTLIATRAAEIGAGDPNGDIDELICGVIEKRGAHSWFTHDEREFLDTKQPEAHACLQFSWRYEAAAVLFWALGRGEDRLDVPVGECDVATITLAARDDETLATQPLRDATAVLDEADLIYRYHWAARQASLDGKTIAGLHPGVVMERHHALNWLIGYDDGEGWDAVPTDT